MTLFLSWRAWNLTKLLTCLIWEANKLQSANSSLRQAVISAASSSQTKQMTCTAYTAQLEVLEMKCIFGFKMCSRRASVGVRMSHRALSDFMQVPTTQNSGQTSLKIQKSDCLPLREFHSQNVQAWLLDQVSRYSRSASRLGNIDVIDVASQICLCWFVVTYTEELIPSFWSLDFSCSCSSMSSYVLPWKHAASIVHRYRNCSWYLFAC